MLNKKIAFAVDDEGPTASQESGQCSRNEQLYRRSVEYLKTRANQLQQEVSELYYEIGLLEAQVCDSCEKKNCVSKSTQTVAPYRSDLENYDHEKSKSKMLEKGTSEYFATGNQNKTSFDLDERCAPSTSKRKYVRSRSSSPQPGSLKTYETGSYKGIPDNKKIRLLFDSMKAKMPNFSNCSSEDNFPLIIGWEKFSAMIKSIYDSAGSSAEDSKGSHVGDN